LFTFVDLPLLVVLLLPQLPRTVLRLPFGYCYGLPTFPFDCTVVERCSLLPRWLITLFAFCRVGSYLPVVGSPVRVTVTFIVYGLPVVGYSRFAFGYCLLRCSDVRLVLGCFLPLLTVYCSTLHVPFVDFVRCCCFTRSDHCVWYARLITVVVAVTPTTAPFYDFDCLFAFTLRLFTGCLRVAPRYVAVCSFCDVCRFVFVCLTTGCLPFV
jgi:hypothetical protein